MRLYVLMHVREDVCVRVCVCACVCVLARAPGFTLYVSMSPHGL